MNKRIELQDDSFKFRVFMNQNVIIYPDPLAKSVLYIQWGCKHGISNAT